MGKRSRKRDVPASRRPEPAPAPAAPRTPRRKARLDELPPAPWSPFPLTELCILLGLVLMGIGFFAGGDRQVELIGSGVGLSALAGLEQSVREHAAGFRSHSTLLAGSVALVLMVGSGLLGVPQVVALGIGLAAFGGAFYVLRRAFALRSGGLTFRA